MVKQKFYNLQPFVIMVRRQAAMELLIIRMRSAANRVMIKWFVPCTKHKYTRVSALLGPRQYTVA